MIEACSSDTHVLIVVCCLQFEGVSPEEHRRLARELAEQQRQCATMELELRAALDKLEVYRRADDTAASLSSSLSAAPPLAGPQATAASMSQQPDEEKGIDELREELCQLRQAMALQGDEALKVGVGALQHGTKSLFQQQQRQQRVALGISDLLKRSNTFEAKQHI